MVQYHTIESNNGYKLSALVTPRGFELPSLTKMSSNGKEYEVEIDNPYFITHHLHFALKDYTPKYLDAWLEQTKVTGIKVKHREEVLEIIDEAIKIGFFKNVE